MLYAKPPGSGYGRICDHCCDSNDYGAYSVDIAIHFQGAVISSSRTGGIGISITLNRRMIKMSRKSSKSGQTMVEYIIIVVIIAIAALAIFGVFSDRIRAMMGGAVVELGGDTSAVDTAVDTPSVDGLKSITKDGVAAP